MDPIDNQCIICSSSVSENDTTLSCNHRFHLQCLLRWARECPNNPTCPICRVVLYESNEVPPQNDSQPMELNNIIRNAINTMHVMRQFEQPDTFSFSIPFPRSILSSQLGNTAPTVPTVPTEEHEIPNTNTNRLGPIDADLQTLIDIASSDDEDSMVSLTEYAFDACKTGDLRSLVHILTLCPQIYEYKTDDGDSLLHSALYSNRYNVSDFLIRSTLLNVNIANDFRIYALHAAIFGGSEQCVRNLLEHNAFIDARTDSGKTALMYSCQSNAGHMTLLLLQRGCDPDITDMEGMSALHYATMSGSISCVENLLESSIDIDIQDRMGDTALHIAIRKGFLEIAKKLLEKGAKLDMENKACHTVLSMSTDTRTRNLIAPFR